MEKLNRSTLNIEEFKKGDIVINCKTEKESIDLFKYLDNKGIIWCSRNKLTKYNIKNYEFGRETCYRFDETGLSYSSIDFYNKYYKIYEWEIIDKNIMKIWNKNTINLEDFVKRDIAIHCDTREKAEDLFNFLHEKGLNWVSGSVLITHTNYKNYEKYTCYDYDEGINYTSMDWYKNHEFQIYEWEILNEETSMISFDEVERSKFTKKIYISHSYSGLERNKRDIEDKVKRLVKEYPNYVFISPVHTFGYLYDGYAYDKGIDLCIELLKTCNEVWIIDDNFVNSKGVMVEREYALNNNMPIRLVEIDN